MVVLVLTAFGRQELLHHVMLSTMAMGNNTDIWYFDSSIRPMYVAILCFALFSMHLRPCVLHSHHAASTVQVLHMPCTSESMLGHGRAFSAHPVTFICPARWPCHSGQGMHASCSTAVACHAYEGSTPCCTVCAACTVYHAGCAWGIQSALLLVTAVYC